MPKLIFPQSDTSLVRKGTIVFAVLLLALASVYWFTFNSPASYKKTISSFNNEQFKIDVGKTSKEEVTYKIKKEKIGFKPVGANMSKAQVEGNTSTYPNIYTNTDLIRETSSKGLKQTYVLKQSGHPTAFKEQMTSSSKVVLEKSGSLSFYKGSKKIAYSPRPFLVDAKGKRVDLNYKIATGQQANLRNDVIASATKQSTTTLTLSLPSLSGLAYPIKVDPSIYHTLSEFQGATAYKVDTSTTPISLEKQSLVYPSVPSGYTYLRAVPVENKSTTDTLPSGYQVSIQVDHAALVSAGKSLGSGDDLRIFYDNGGSLVELDRWAETAFNQNNTKIWFKTQAEINTTAIDNNYYLVYGNNSATNPPSDGDNIFEFFDDFTGSTIDTTKWSVTDTGSNLSQDNQLIINNGADSWTGTAMHSLQNFDRSSLVVSAKYRSTLEIGANYKDTTMLFWKDATNEVSYVNYIYSLYLFYEQPWSNGLYMYEDGSNGARISDFNFTSTNYIRQILKAAGGAITQISSDNKNWTTVYDSSYSTESPLKVGFTHYQGGRVYIDDFKVQKHISAEPSTTVGPEGTGGAMTPYYDSGTLTSDTIDIGAGYRGDINSLSWVVSEPGNTIQPANTELKYQIAANYNNSTWNYVGPDGTASTYFTEATTHSATATIEGRFFRYKAYFSTNDNNYSPNLTSLNIDYDSQYIGDKPGGDLVIDGFTYTIEGDKQGINGYKSITVKNGGNLIIQPDDSDDGAFIDVTYTGGTNKILVEGNSTITAKSYGASPVGKGVILNAADVQVDAGSKITADGQGYGSASGPGAGGSGGCGGGGTAGGGGYGGNGSGSCAPVGIAYDADKLAYPNNLGSGGGVRGGPGRAGGGAVKINATDNLINYGSISANGDSTIDWSMGGAGSGGSIFISTNNLTGTGIISANGGTGLGWIESGSGGGGRIAIYYDNKSAWTGPVTKSGGIGDYTSGQPGTLFWGNNNLAIHSFSNQSKLDGTTPLKTGEKTNETGLKLSLWYQQEAGTFYGFTPEVEIKPVNEAFDGTDIIQGQELLTSNPLYRITVNVPSGVLTDGVAYHWRARLKNGIGRTSEWMPYGNNSDGDPANSINADTDFEVNAASPGGGTTFPDLSLDIPSDLVNDQASLNIYQNKINLNGPYELTFGNNTKIDITQDLALDTNTKLELGNDSILKTGDPLVLNTGNTITMGNQPTLNLASLNLNGGSLITGNNSQIDFPLELSTGSISLGDNSTITTNTGALAVGENLNISMGNSFTYQPGTTINGGSLTLGNNTNASPVNLNIDHITLNKGSFSLPSNSTITRTSDLTVGATGPAQFTIGGNSTLNMPAQKITIANNSSLIPKGYYTTSNDGKGLIVNAKDVQIDKGSSIYALGHGYRGGIGGDWTYTGWGPGGGSIIGSYSHGTGIGGSYGGLGGLQNISSPITYGSSNNPIDIGSGGGASATHTSYSYYGNGGAGGGAVKLVVSDTITINGTINTNGADYDKLADEAFKSAGGSGGSIWIDTDKIQGYGSLSAQGGAGSLKGGAGGGGRIAVYSNINTVNDINVGGGISSIVGAQGTIVNISKDTTAPSIAGKPQIISAPEAVTPSWNWTASTDNQSGIRGYYVYVSNNPAGEGPYFVNGELTKTNSYTHATSLAPGSYYAFVKAVDNAGNVSDASAIGYLLVKQSITALNMPQYLNVELPPFPSTNVNLSWQAPPTADAVRYKVYRNNIRITDTNKNSAQMLSDTVFDTAFTDKTASAGNTYYYQVSSINPLGIESPVSALTIKDNVSLPATQLTATWTTKEDFENNASTMGTVTNRTNVDTISVADQLRILSPAVSETIDTGTGLDGDVTISTNMNIKDLKPGYDPANGVVPNFRNLTITSTGSLTADSATKLEFKVKGLLNIQEGSKIETNSKGYTAGPGYGQVYHGAGYGGKGGFGYASGSWGSYIGYGGDVYNSDFPQNQVFGSGSSGAYCCGGPPGGGALRIEAESITLNGSVLSNGGDGDANMGGASGGSIYIMSPNQINAGTSALVSAAGGQAFGYIGSGEGGSIEYNAPGGGGGGRIAIATPKLNGDPTVTITGGQTQIFDSGWRINEHGQNGQYIAPTFNSPAIIGENGPGLRVQVGQGRADWQNIDWTADTLDAGQNIEFQIKTANTVDDLTSAGYLGPDGTNNTWFDANNKTIPDSVTDSKYAELKVKLSSLGTDTPTLKDISLNYNSYTLSELNQYKANGTTLIPTGKTITDNSLILEAANLSGYADSTGLKAQFEVKPTTIDFDETGIIDGNVASIGGTSRATVSGLNLGDYHWHSRIVDDQGRISAWSNYGNNSDSIPAATDFKISATLPPDNETPISIGDGLFNMPLYLNVQQGSGFDINISWQAPPTGDAARYKVYRSTIQINESNKAWAELLTSANFSTTYTDVKVVTGRTYYYQVSAVNNQGIESTLSTMVLNDKVTVLAREQSATWTTKDDFDGNLRTTGDVTTKFSADTSSTWGDLKIAPVAFNTGDGTEGDLILDGITAENSTDGQIHDSSNPYVLDGVHKFSNVTLQNGATLTHSTEAGADTGPAPFGNNTGVEGLELYITGSLSIDTTSKIDVTGKGYLLGPGAGCCPDNGIGAGGYGGLGGGGRAYLASWGWSSNQGRPYGTPYGIEYMGSGSYYEGVNGGGRVKIVASSIDIDGSIQANGLGGKGYYYGGGPAGSGGGIYLAAEDIDVSGYVSAAGGGGGGSNPDYLPGSPGLNGVGGASGYGTPGGQPTGAEGDGGSGPSAGAGHGGAAGRIFINYSTYNNTNVNNGMPGYAPSANGGVVGPWAYFVNTRTATIGADLKKRHYPRSVMTGRSGVTYPAEVGLRYDALNSADWKRLDFNAEPLKAGENIQFQIKVANTLAGLENAEFMGYNATANTWFDKDNKTIPESLDGTRYIEVRVKLSSNSATSPILHDVTVHFDTMETIPADFLHQYKSDSRTKIPVGGATNENEVVLEIANVLAFADSTGLYAEFEVKPTNLPFDGLNTFKGNKTAPEGASKVNAIINWNAIGYKSYHWRARILDEQGRASQWTNFGGNTEGALPNIGVKTDFFSDTEPPLTPPTPSTDTPTTDTTPTWNWNEAVDNGSGISNYRLYVGTTPGGSDIISGQVLATNSYTHTSALPLGTYYAHLIATDKAGNYSLQSDNGTVTIANTVPSDISGAPKDLKVEIRNLTNNVDVTWKKPSSGQVDHYNVYRAYKQITNINKTQAKLMKTTTIPSYVDTSITSATGKTYYYQVTAVDSLGNESLVASYVNNNVTFPGNEIATWTVKEDFENNASTTQSSSSNSDVNVTADDVMIDSTVDTGTGAQGDVVIDSTKNINEFISGYDPDLNIVPNFNNLTITSTGNLTTTQMVKLIFKVKGTLTIENGGMIDAVGKGYGGSGGPGVGLPGSYDPARGHGGGGYGGRGGDGYNNPNSGGPSYDSFPDFGSRSGAGRNGGGQILINSNKISINGYINANGEDDIPRAYWECDHWIACYAGGGSGGSVLIYNKNILDFPSNSISVEGGTGLGASSGGGGGRIKIGAPQINGSANIGAGGGYAGGQNGVYTNSPSFITYTSPGYIGGTGGGLRVDAGENKALWQSIDWDTEPLEVGQKIEFQIRVADTLEDLASATYVGIDGTSATWFDESNKNIPSSILSSRYAELRMKLSANSGTPIVHSVTFNYDKLNAFPASELVQYKSDGSTIIGLGSYINQTSATLEAQGVTGLSDSTDLRTQFEIKPVGTAFDLSTILNGNIAPEGEASKTLIATLAQGGYHWRARIIDSQGRSSNWVSFGDNAEDAADFYVDTTAPAKPGAPSTTSASNDRTPSFSWSNSSDNLSGINGYYISIGTSSGEADILANTFVNANSYTQSAQLSPGTYYVNVKAEDKALNLSEVSTTQFSVLSNTAANLKAEAEPSPSTYVNLTWTGPSSGIAGYNVYRHTERITNENLSSAERIAEVVTETKYTDKLGFQGEEYFYQVTSVDTSGAESEISTSPVNDQVIVGGTNPHTSFSTVTGKCRNCHKIHLAKGTTKLFRKSADNENVVLCYTCHDGSGSMFDIRSTLEGKGAHRLHLATPTDTGIVCTQCHHPHNASNYQGVGGGERMTKRVEENLCLGCHDKPISQSGWNIKEQFSKTSRHAVTSVTADGLPGAKIECSSCHNPHVVKRAATYDKNNPEAYAKAKLVDPFNVFKPWEGTFIDFCLNCHGKDEDELPKKTASGDVFVPFSIQFPNVSEFPFFPGWKKSSFKESAHGKNGVTCRRCHFAHGTDNTRINAFYDEETNTYNTTEEVKEERLCFKCHNENKVLGAPDIQAVFNKAYSHPIKRTREKHKDTETTADLGATNRHAECFDCHDPHQTKAISNPNHLRDKGTNFAGNPLRGIKGIGVINGIPGLTETLYYLANPIVYEYQLCFKCHSSSTNLPSTSIDKAAEFNTNNKSFHPVQATGKNLGIKDEAFVVGTPWNPTADVYDASGVKISGDDPDYGLNGSVTDPDVKLDTSYPSKVTCTNCHNNSDPNGARGPHGSDNKYFLKKPADNNELCLTCHNQDAYTGSGRGTRFRVGDWNGHAFHLGGGAYCLDCHTPHGRKDRPHLLGGSMVINVTESGNQLTCEAACHNGWTMSFTMAYPHINEENLETASNRIEETSTEIKYTGRWELMSIPADQASKGGYIEALNYKFNDGAKASLSFTGTGIQIRANKFAEGGKFKVFIDGTYNETIDLQIAPDAESVWTTVFQATGLENGKHTLEVILTEGITDWSSYKAVRLDAFDVE